MSSTKERCTFWEKCYRKEKNHLTNYLHPADLKAEATPPKPTLRTKKTLELSDDTDTKAATTKPAVPKPGLRTRKTHELSIVDDSPDTKGDGKKEKKEKKKAEPMETEEEPKPRPPKRAASIPAGKRREKCTYWAKCFRKDQGHKKLYIHPGDPDEHQAAEKLVGGHRTRTATRPQPLNRMDSVDSVSVGAFTLKRTGSVYECTCASFTGIKNHGKASNLKTCSHLKSHLGSEFEAARCNLPAKGKKVPIPQHIQVSVLLAHKYTETTNPTGWWMSEKLDGVRAFWNGRCFYSRLGNAFYAPDWFTEGLPRNMHLDGELFGGRKKFQSTVSIVKTPEHPSWNKIMYCVFDAPHIEKEPFEKRMEAIKDYFDKNKSDHVKVVEHTKCTGRAMVDKELKRIIAAGGEGLMIREPKSRYERTRSKTLLKIKKFHDAEARVVGYEPSKSNHSITGSLWVQMANGRKFKVGSGMTNKDRRSPPKKGTIITYKFQEYSNSGCPRFPTYIGIRIDMTEPKDAEGVVTEATDD